MLEALDERLELEFDEELDDRLELQLDEEFEEELDEEFDEEFPAKCNRSPLDAPPCAMARPIRSSGVFTLDASALAKAAPVAARSAALAPLNIPKSFFI